MSPYGKNIMKIFKYSLNITDYQIVNIPHLRGIIEAQMQGDQLVLWAMIDKELGFYSGVNIYIVGTGEEFNDCSFSQKESSRNYLTTFQNAGFVGHLFYNFND